MGPADWAAGNVGSRSARPTMAPCTAPPIRFWARHCAPNSAGPAGRWQFSFEATNGEVPKTWQTHHRARGPGLKRLNRCGNAPPCLQGPGKKKLLFENAWETDHRAAGPGGPGFRAPGSRCRCALTPAACQSEHRYTWSAWCCGGSCSSRATSAIRQDRWTVKRPTSRCRRSHCRRQPCSSKCAGTNVKH